MLPKVKYPLRDIFVYSLDKEIPFRQLLVKEERLLESPDTERKVLLESMCEVVSNCSLGEIDGTTLPIFDLQLIFLKLLEYSKTEIPNWLFACEECGEANEVEISLSNFDITRGKFSSPVIELRENLIVTMRYPTAKEIFETAEGKEFAEFYDIATKCIVAILYEDEFLDVNDEEKIEFVDNLTKGEFEEIKYFFANMPVVNNKIEFNCVNCETKNTAYMNGFLGEAI